MTAFAFLHNANNKQTISIIVQKTKEIIGARRDHENESYDHGDVNNRTMGLFLDLNTRWEERKQQNG